MFRLTRITAAGAALVLVALTGVQAAAGLETRKAAVRNAVKTGRINGFAWDAESQPAKRAVARLRNTISGVVRSVAVGAKGQFVFPDVESGSYVVEILSESGRVLAVGKSFVVDGGEAVITFVRLPARLPWFTGFFTNAASASVSAASSLGITGIAPTGSPVSR